MPGVDTLRYHMPFAARFAQDGSIHSLAATQPDPLTLFYPLNAELLHALGIVLTGYDVLAPLLNVGWLAVALLAAWCIGRPYGVAPLTLLGANVVMGSWLMTWSQAGEASNDVTGVALLLAAAAIVVNARWRPARARAGGAARGACDGHEGVARRRRRGAVRCAGAGGAAPGSPRGARAVAGRAGRRGRLLVLAQPRCGGEPGPRRRRARPAEDPGRPGAADAGHRLRLDARASGRRRRGSPDDHRRLAHRPGPRVVGSRRGRDLRPAGRVVRSAASGGRPCARRHGPRDRRGVRGHAAEW